MCLIETNWNMAIDIPGDEYRTNGFVIVRGLFEADRLREITGEVERVAYDASKSPIVVELVAYDTLEG